MMCVWYDDIYTPSILLKPERKFCVMIRILVLSIYDLNLHDLVMFLHMLIVNFESCEMKNKVDPWVIGLICVVATQ